MTTALISEIDQIPDQPAVFLMWASEGAPYLARTALLRRRIRRVLSKGFGRVVERIEYQLVGSQLESMLVHLGLAQRHFPEDWPRLTRLKPPAFVRLLLHNPFPRMAVTTRLGRGLFVGPFANRTLAEKFEAEVHDLFQLRRCEENLAPSPDHPGCIYGEMNRCLRPCQQAVSPDEYRHEAERVEQFLRSGGASLSIPAEAARDRASTALEFEEAERLHQRLTRINEVTSAAGDLARTLDQLCGVAVAPSSESGCVELLFLAGGVWQDPRRLTLGEAGQSMDTRLRELTSGITAAAAPNLEHLSLLMRWYGSSWRDGEWISFESLEKIPYRKIVNAVSRVSRTGL